jgi:WD40 repeat protein
VQPRLRLRMFGFALLLGSLLIGASPADAGDRDGSAAPRQLWADRYHTSPNGIDEAYDIEVSQDGATAYVTGRSDELQHYNDYATIAYDVGTGERIWVSRFNGPKNRSDAAYDLGLSPDGSRVFVTGYTNDTAQDFATIAYDAATGDELWHAMYDGPANGDDVAKALGVSPDGSAVYVAGYVDGPDENYGIVAYDPANGNLLWDARYNGGGDSYDAAYALGVSPDGSTVFVTGLSYGRGLNGDFVTIAFDASTGARRWIKRYDGSAHDFDSGRDLVVSPDGSTVFVTGSTNGYEASADYAAIAYDTATGALRWIARYDGHGAEDTPSAIGVSPDGSAVFVSGTSDRSDVPFDSDVATLALDAETGDRAWVARYDHAGDYETGQTLAVSPDGSAVYVAGEAVSDYLIVSYDATTGAPIWRAQIRRNRLDVARALAVTPDSSTVLVTGSMWQGDPDYMMDYGTVALSADR